MQIHIYSWWSLATCLAKSTTFLSIIFVVTRLGRILPLYIMYRIFNADLLSDHHSENESTACTHTKWDDRLTQICVWHHCIYYFRINRFASIFREVEACLFHNSNWRQEVILNRKNCVVVKKLCGCYHSIKIPSYIVVKKNLYIFTYYTKNIFI